MKAKKLTVKQIDKKINDIFDFVEKNEVSNRDLKKLKTNLTKYNKMLPKKLVLKRAIRSIEKLNMSGDICYFDPAIISALKAKLKEEK